MIAAIVDAGLPPLRGSQLFSTQFEFVPAAMIVVALALYLAVPIIIAAVLRGQSPLTTAAMTGMQMSLTALGLASSSAVCYASRCGFE